MGKKVPAQEPLYLVFFVSLRPQNIIFMKKIDLYILKQYLLLFAGTFFICLFIFMMQFLWRYVDDLVGKGLSWGILLQFFFYAGLTLVPMSLPLAVLLTSLISFGNMGEKLELLSMKAAGIPLIRILQPTFIFILMVCGGSFYFQNNTSPYATKQLATLLWSMRQKNPEVEIPEGIFYNEIPGYNLFVEHKNKETGMLYGMMIYTTGGNIEEAQIILADSARLQSTADHMHLKLTLYSGERFKNMSGKSGNMLRANVPYMRETFVREVDLIPFDNNFSMMDGDLFNRNAKTKSLSAISLAIDSIDARLDSLADNAYTNLRSFYLKRDIGEDHNDYSVRLQRARHLAEVAEENDSAFAHKSLEKRQLAVRRALTQAKSTHADVEFRGIFTHNDNQNLRQHQLEQYSKFSLSLACLIFFLIGAPLGAIIRKGGLGVPVVVSVVIFIFYYIVNVAGEKMAKSGEWNMLFGAWLSSAILTPIGIFLVTRANKDSTVFNIEGYRRVVMSILGLRATRKINRKEVIIHDPDYPVVKEKLLLLASDSERYMHEHRLRFMPSYVKLFFHYQEDAEVISISERLEEIVSELHNSRDNVVIGAIGEFPILTPDAHTRPFRNKRMNMALGIIFPLGLFFWLRIWRYRLRLLRDLKEISRYSPMIVERIDLHILAQEIQDNI